jgi:hypothetical protein
MVFLRLLQLANFWYRKLENKLKRGLKCGLSCLALNLEPVGTIGS